MSKSSGFHDAVLTIAGILAIMLVVRYAQSIVVPFLLSLFIAIIMSVPVGWFRKRGISVSIAVGIVFLLTIILEVLLVWMLGNTVTQFNEALPGYQSRLNELMERFGNWLLSKDINVSETGILAALDPKVVLGFAKSLMLSVGELLSNTVLIMFIVLFMLLETWTFPAKVHAMRGAHAGNVMAEIINVIDSTKHYIVMKALTSLATGILVGLGLSWVGLDYALLWGFLAFAFNFIPNIGSILAAIPAVLLSFLQLGPVEILIVIIIYIVTNTVIGNLIEPNIMGRRVGLSTLVVFLSLLFWGWLLGPVGMLLSVPLTMLIKFSAQASEQTQWLAVLLAPAPLPAIQEVEQGKSVGE